MCPLTSLPEDRAALASRNCFLKSSILPALRPRTVSLINQFGQENLFRVSPVATPK